LRARRLFARSLITRANYPSQSPPPLPAGLRFERLLLTVLLALVILSPATLSAPAIEDLFQKTCAPCHGKDGKANTPAGKKAGAKDLSISKTTPAEIEKQITDGKADSKGSIKMPAFSGKITPDEIKALTDYVLAFRKK
jgi:mono/diheme cytochrome c family protein